MRPLRAAPESPGCARPWAPRADARPDQAIRPPRCAEDHRPHLRRDQRGPAGRGDGADQGHAREDRGEDEEQRADDERGHQRREDGPDDAAGLPASDDAAEKRPHEGEPEEQEGDHQHPEGGADDAVAPGVAHGRSLRVRGGPPCGSGAPPRARSRATSG